MAGQAVGGSSACLNGENGDEGPLKAGGSRHPCRATAVVNLETTDGSWQTQLSTIARAPVPRDEENASASLPVAPIQANKRVPPHWAKGDTGQDGDGQGRDKN